MSSVSRGRNRKRAVQFSSDNRGINLVIDSLLLGGNDLIAKEAARSTLQARPHINSLRCYVQPRVMAGVPTRREFQTSMATFGKVEIHGSLTGTWKAKGTDDYRCKRFQAEKPSCRTHYNSRWQIIAITETEYETECAVCHAVGD